MFSHFFIDRPIFASVLSIVITLAGVVAAMTLPIAQFPPITPPSIWVQCNYPGANAQEVADSVAAPIEQQINGVEDMLYMVSQSNNDGSYQLTVTFKPGVNLSFAQVLVQNRINLAMPSLPEVVKQAGVTTRKRNPDILMVIGLYSPSGRYDQLYLSNYATIKIRDELSRVAGVGDCQQFGQQDYSMRIWLDPDRLAALNVSATDVVRVVRERNRQIAAGHIAQEPTPDSQARQLTITTKGRLSEPSEFEDISIRTLPDGRRIRIRDVGQVKLGAKSLDNTSRLDGKPNASLAIFALPDANSLAVATRVREKLEELKKSFPDDLDYDVSLDMTPFIRESINEVVRTLIEAIVLVAIVVMLFLQNWRSALIPLCAVPVAVIGTFAVMAAIGFSLNNLTLFGLVLAIGIVVDDAIVVVEAVEHHIEEGLSPRAAAHKAMEQVSAPVVAVALVLSAVFIPCAFITGINGQFFRQFALTIAVSTIISAFNSLTLSPALAALLLPPRGARKDVPGRVLDLAFGWLFRGFNWAFGFGRELYLRLVGRALRGAALVLVLYGGLVALTWWTSNRLPLGYIPNQDQGRFYITVQLPDAASMERTQWVVDRIRDVVQPMPEVVHVTGIAGQSFTLNANASNFGQFFITLHEFDQRRDPAKHAFAVADRVKAKLADEVPQAQMATLTPPAVSGLGSGSGFKVIIEDRGDLGLAELSRQVDRVVAAANAGRLRLTAESLQELRAPHPATKAGAENAAAPLPDAVLEELDALRDHEYLAQSLLEAAIADILDRVGITDAAERSPIEQRVVGATRSRKVVGGLLSVFRANTPQFFVDINRPQCQSMGVNPNDVFATLQVYLGSLYVNDFNRFGRTWQVIVQAMGSFRTDPEKIKQLKVRNAGGEMVPLGDVVHVKPIGGPINIGRYNMYPAAAILGNTEPGISSGQGIDEVEAICQALLPPGMAYEWTEINFMQLDAAKNIGNRLVFPLAVVFVFLVLAAQYESWSLPLAVILVVPMCILGSLTGVWVTGGDINIFTQIGFVVLVGLASKNAILIVEFAKHLHEEGGLSRREATLAACRLRLRPILMTSFAFILGVLPLVITTGAGAEMRRTLGTAVFSGMLGVTLFGLILTPVFFYIIAGFVERPAFTSQRAQQFAESARYALRILTLGVPWLVQQATTRKKRTQGKPADNPQPPVRGP